MRILLATDGSAYSEAASQQNSRAEHEEKIEVNTRYVDACRGRQFGGEYSKNKLMPGSIDVNEYDEDQEYPYQECRQRQVLKTTKECFD